ncbi:hypothetical protein SUGI_0222810 [Cryptomeria japonica]|nr:hypothetical protein SUGI_0222810 [Cryptomeria japonica]
MAMAMEIIPETGCSYRVSLDNKLFVIGLLRDNFTNALVIYNFSSGKWKRGPNLPDGRDYSCCLVDSANGLIYIAEGWEDDGREVQTTIVYDIKKEK